MIALMKEAKSTFETSVDLCQAIRPETTFMFAAVKHEMSPSHNHVCRNDVTGEEGKCFCGENDPEHFPIDPSDIIGESSARGHVPDPAVTSCVHTHTLAVCSRNTACFVIRLMLHYNTNK